MNQRILHALFFCPTPEGFWGLPAILHGEPGSGKTSNIKAVSKSSGLPHYRISPGERGEGQFGVVPVPGADGLLHYPPPDWIHLLTRGGILFVDEINTAPPMIQAPLLGLVQLRVLGSYTFDSRVRVIGAANSTSDAAGGWDLAPALANRFGHYNFEGLDSNAWVEGLLGGFGSGSEERVAPNPEVEEARVMAAWPAADAFARGLIGGFIFRRPELLHKRPEKMSAQASMAWPSRRCYDEKTEVLTRRGFVGWPDVTQNDEFASRTPDGEMVFTRATRLFSDQYDDDMIRFKTRGVDLLVTPNHNMYVADDCVGGEPGKGRHRSSKEFRLVPAADVERDLAKKKSYAIRFARDVTSWEGKSGGHKIIAGRKIDWRVWAEFVGWYATDGSIQLLRGRYPHIRITQVDAKCRARVASLAAQLGADKVWLSKKGKKEITIQDQAIYDELLPLGYKHKGERRAPRDIMDRDTDTISAFVAGCLGGDGWTKPDGRISFGVGFCAGLAADLQEAAIKLGHTASVSTHVTRDNALVGKASGKTVYQADFGGLRYSHPKMTAKGISRERYSGRIYCAEVPPHHTLLVRRNGNAVWCGNSVEYSSVALASARVHGLNEIDTDELLSGFVGQAWVAEFRTWQNNADLPDPAEVLDGTVKFTHDERRLDRSLAVLSACSALVIPDKAAKRGPRAAACWRLIDQVSRTTADIAIPAARALAVNRVLEPVVGKEWANSGKAALSRLLPLLNETF